MPSLGFTSTGQAFVKEMSVAPGWKKTGLMGLVEHKYGHPVEYLLQLGGPRPLARAIEKYLDVRLSDSTLVWWRKRLGVPKGGLVWKTHLR